MNNSANCLSSKRSTTSSPKEQANAEHFPIDYPQDYLDRKAAFLDDLFYLDENVFCPRPETEGLVLLAEKKMLKGGMILDAGCGSGCVGLSLLRRHSQYSVTLSDISLPALTIAKRNACQLLSSNTLPTFVQGDLTQSLFRNEIFSAILCNPPYIARSEWQIMDSSLFYEPKIAWDGGKDGLQFIAPFLPRAYAALKEKGSLFMEIGFAQAEAVGKLFRAYFPRVTLYKDLAGLPRYLVGEK